MAVHRFRGDVYRQLLLPGQLAIGCRAFSPAHDDRSGELLLSRAYVGANTLG